jgi:23S rRNA U2552 (ribose-2'-O)-methylase RlmE/FtsJ
MTIFLNSIKQSTFNPTFSINSDKLINLYNHCSKFKDTNYSFVDCGVAKGGCIAMMKYASGKNNKIFGFDTFDSPLNNIDIVYTVITRLEVSRLNAEIEKLDPNAFVVMNTIKDTKGGMVKKRPLNH